MKAELHVMLSAFQSNMLMTGHLFNKTPLLLESEGLIQIFEQVQGSATLLPAVVGYSTVLNSTSWRGREVFSHQ